MIYKWNVFLGKYEMKNRVFLKIKLFFLYLIVYCWGKVSDLKDNVLFLNMKIKFGKLFWGK